MRVWCAGYARVCAALSFAGAAMLGELERSGVGAPVCVDYVKNLDELRASCKMSNEALLRELREDSNANALMSLTREDAAMGRMTQPTPVGMADLSDVLLNPRFGVEQDKEDGTKKVRAIDHLSWSPGTGSGEGATPRPTKRARKEASVNGHTAPGEKMKHDTLDMLATAMRQHFASLGCVPGLIKVGMVLHVCRRVARMQRACTG